MLKEATEERQINPLTSRMLNPLHSESSEKHAEEGVLRTRQFSRIQEDHGGEYCMRACMHECVCACWGRGINKEESHYHGKKNNTQKC